MLLYATDFADRLEKEIIPALKAGFIVLSDRYIYTAMARAGVRGVDRTWIRNLYGFAIAPHLVFYLKIDEKTLIRRVLQSRGMDYWESGMDMKLGDDIYESFRAYQRRCSKSTRRCRTSSGSACSTRAGRSTSSRTSCAGRSGRFWPRATSRTEGAPAERADPLTARLFTRNLHR